MFFWWLSYAQTNAALVHYIINDNLNTVRKFRILFVQTKEKESFSNARYNILK